MADGFLGRWSRRKLDVNEGKPVEAEPSKPLQVVPAQAAIHEANASALSQSRAEPPVDPGLPRDDKPPPPTLDDVKALTSESDFSAFAGRNVDPEVKNAAMKKLFSDPRYNVMDGMDVYTGDYSKPDPIPPEMLRQLVSARFLKLFDEEEKKEEATDEAKVQQEADERPRDAADDPAAQSVAQSGSTSQADPAPPDHADPDLRLQQDHAAPGKNAGGGAE